MFTDIEGSTRLAQMLGVGYRAVLHEHRRLLRDVLSGNGGIPLFVEGDSLFVAFADAMAALDGCARAQRALAGHVWPTAQARPLVRMGLHTGYARPLGGEYASPEVHRAARVAAAAHGGQVLCSGATAATVDTLPDGACLVDLGLFRLRGFDGREHLHQLVAPGLDRHFPRPRTAGLPPHNLPDTATSFVGRTAEQGELAALLSTHRLVTVVGPAGAGKSRLAVQVARPMTCTYPDGVWFADVAGVTDPGEVAGAVAAALGLRPEPGRAVVDTVTEYVVARQMLIVLDTCDAHLTAAALLVNRLLAACPDVRVLATSREPLGVAGEVVWRVSPLSLRRPADGGGHSPAVTLLLDRAAAARGGRRPQGAEVDALARVADRLDGLPLALELAATRLRVLSATELAARLDDVLAVLDAGSAPLDDPPAAGRHTSMRAALNWSYRGLDPDAARLLRWLAVFAGPVDLSAVESLLRDNPLDPLAVLVDKSLVQPEPGPGGMVYRTLGPVRGYAARLLAEAGEEDTARHRHVAWALDALGRVRQGPGGRPVTLSLYAVDPLAGELRAALRWSVTRGSARDGLRIAAGLDQWWRERGLAREGRLWLFKLYERIGVTGEHVPDAELAAGYHLHAAQAGADGEYAEQLRFMQRAEDAARRAGANGLLAGVLAGRGGLLVDLGDLVGAERVCRDVIAWAERRHAAAEALGAVFCLAKLLWRRGALDEAAELLAAARPLEAARPTDRGQRDIDMLLGLVALSRGDLVAAHDHLVVALRSQMGYGFEARAAETLNTFAVRCAVGGEPDTAARLFGAARAARSRLRVPAGLVEPYWSREERALREALGDAAFDSAYAEGTAMDLDDAAAVAAGVAHPDLAVDSDRFSSVSAG